MMLVCSVFQIPLPMAAVQWKLLLSFLKSVFQTGPWKGMSR